MARQRNDAREAQREPTWANVAETIGWLESTYAGHVEVCMDTEGTGKAQGQMWVYAKLYRGWAITEARPTDVARALWPTARHKTMTGLVYRLLHQLDHMADARTRAEAEELPF